MKAWYRMFLAIWVAAVVLYIFFLFLWADGDLSYFIGSLFYPPAPQDQIILIFELIILSLPLVLLPFGIQFRRS